jgi:peptide/nickel transport system substrate-binding protein
MAQEGGWHLFFTAFGGADVSNPLTSLPLNAAGMSGFAGWPDDKDIQALRIRFGEASGADQRKQVAADLQKLAFERVIYVPLGQIATPAAWSAKLSGVLDGPAVPYFWNMDKP